MTIRFVADVASEPLNETFRNNLLYFELSDTSSEEQITQFIRDYTEAQNFDVDMIAQGQDDQLDALMGALRELPYMERVEQATLIAPFYSNPVFEED